MNGCAALHLAARLVKSQILKWLITTSLLSLFLSLSAPLSPGRCRHLFAVSRQLNAKEHLMHETDRWGKPGELPSHNNLTETAGPGPLQGKKKNQKKRKLLADSTASFVCVTSTCWHASGTVPFPRSSKIICVRIWEEIRHIIVRLCIMMPSAAPICARINILFMFKWHTLLNCHSVYLPFYRQVSSRSCSLASFVPHLFFLSQLKSVRQLCGLLFVGTSPVPPPLFRSELCFFFFCMCMFVCAWQRGKKSEMKEVSGVHKGKSDREREREGGWERLAMWVGLAVWVGVPVKLQIINKKKII